MRIVVTKSGGFGDRSLPYQHRRTAQRPTGMTHSQDPRPRIAITIGDPGGIGAEIALKALADPRLAEP